MKLNVIIPVRNMDKELEILKLNLSKIFTQQNIEATYYIVYQEDDVPFNKGMLNNIGFLIARVNNKSDNFLFNDVTVFPLSSEVYNFNHELNTDEIYNPYGYKFCVSRFFMTNGTTFKKINGYSNKYNGWGYEDTDLQKRILYKSVKINREIFWLRENNSVDLLNSDKFHDKLLNMENKMKEAENTTKKIFDSIWNNSKIVDRRINILLDGLSSLNIYKYINNIKYSSNCIKIYVSIGS